LKPFLERDFLVGTSLLVNWDVTKKTTLTALRPSVKKMIVGRDLLLYSPNPTIRVRHDNNPATDQIKSDFMTLAVLRG
jgi:hypothetical protein